MKKLTFVLFTALVLTACGASEKAGSANPPTTTNTATKTAETTTTTVTTTSGVTGVAACDEYLAKVEKLMSNPNVPPATRDMYKQTLEQNRTAWKQAASTPQGKAGLESGCKTALEAIKPALEQYGK